MRSEPLTASRDLRAARRRWLLWILRTERRHPGFIDRVDAMWRMLTDHFD